MLGPLPQSDNIHVSPIGLVPKGHKGDAWRMIVDLLYPGGRSVNDNISSGFCSLQYPSVDNAVSFILALGRHTQLMKIDLKDAFRLKSLVTNWLGRRSGQRSEVESLLGHLSHAAVVFKPG